MAEDAPPDPFASPDAANELRDQARSAWSLGLAAMGLAMVAPCGSYITLLAALPLGIVAMTRARQVLEGGVALDGATEVYARTARITGLITSIWSGLLLFLLIAFVLLYVGLIAMTVGMAVALPPPQPSP